MPVKDNQKTLIIGANFAGLKAAAALPPQSGVTLIDRSPRFEWTPNLHEVLSGVTRPDDLMLDRRKIAERLGHRFLTGEIESLDPDRQQLQLSGQQTLDYDTCIVACGLTSHFHDVTGAAAHAIPFRTAKEASTALARLSALLSEKQAVTISIVGGGFTGVELLGELLRRFRNESRLTFRLFERGQQLLEGQPAVVSQDIRKLCAPYSVDIRFGARIRSVGKESIELENGETLASHLTLWTAGTTGPRFIQNSVIEHNAQGMVRVNPSLQSASHPSVFVAGDLAALPEPVLKQAYHAMDMGALAAKNLSHYQQGQTLQTFIPAPKPLALAFGDLNTYLIQGDTVLASPLLAAAKEAVYQLYMTQLSANLPLPEFSKGISRRASRSFKNLLLPELVRLRWLALLKQSRVLQWGGLKDLDNFARGLAGTFR